MRQAALRRGKQDAETCRKKSLSHKGKKKSPETREKMRLAALKEKKRNDK